MTRVGSRSGSEGTRKNYLYLLNKFCEHTGKKPGKLVLERKNHLESRDEFVRKGHSLGELDRAYSRPTVDNLRDAYRRAESYMTVSKLNIPDVENMKRDMMLTMFQQFARMMGYDPAKIVLNWEDEVGGKLSINEEIELLQNALLEGVKKKNVENNRREHKIVTEEELTEYLNEGWYLIQEFSNGKFVVRNPFPSTDTQTPSPIPHSF